MRKVLKNKKGIVGIEAAIVLIAFIIVAAALSYVVINMGFYITQKTKDTMQSGLDESLSALQPDGLAAGKTNDEGYIEWIIFPVKLSVGKEGLDLKKEAIVVSVYLPNATLLNIYNGVYMESVEADCDILIMRLSEACGMNETDMAMFVIYNGDSDTVLEPTEKAFLIVHLNSTVADVPGARHAIADYETFKIEVKGAKGSALTVVRTAPGGMPKNTYVNMG